jgi:hypothetical protein
MAGLWQKTYFVNYLHPDPVYPCNSGSTQRSHRVIKGQTLYISFGKNRILSMICTLTPFNRLSRRLLSDLRTISLTPFPFPFL